MFSNFNYDDLFPKPPEESKPQKAKFKTSLGVVSEAERNFLETLQEEHKSIFTFHFVKSIGGFHATVLSNESVWSSWIKFMLVERSKKIAKLKEIALLQDKPRPSPAADEACEGIYFIRQESNLKDITGHIRFKTYIDPNNSA